MNKQDIQRVAALVAKVVQPLEARIKELEEQAKSVEYKGTYSSDSHYKRGNFVTHKGALWHANEPSHGVIPGTSGHWQLAVKSGRQS